MYNTTAKRLKGLFPELKIGGPALAFIEGKEWLENFLDSIEIQPDFFSWHIYVSDDVNYFPKTAKYVRELMDKRGWNNTELIINEWNYVKSFQTDKWIYSLHKMVDIKGASFVAAVMSVCQYSDVDMLMYYDARPCGMNGLFSQVFYEKLKGYYVFEMFRNLYALKESISFVSNDKDIFGCASKNDDKSAIMLTYFNDEDNLDKKTIAVELLGYKADEWGKIKVYFLTGQDDMKFTDEYKIDTDNYKINLTVEKFETVYIEILK